MIATKPSPTAAPGPAGHSVLSGLLSRPYPAVMGVLNVTPDSFSDGGQFAAPERALAQARRMIAEGADIIDIGAESTRPYGSEPISAEEELQRLQPVLPEIVALGIPVSIDSMKSAVVAWALHQGAAIANDIWGLQRDSGMAGLVAARVPALRLPVLADRHDVVAHPRILGGRADRGQDVAGDPVPRPIGGNLLADPLVHGPHALRPADVVVALLAVLEQVAQDLRPVVHELRPVEELID